MSRAVLLALAERCEREEPNIGMNTAIAIEMGAEDGDLIPDYTTSLDAAVTLVPEDPANPGKPMLWSITYDEDGVGGPRGYCGALGKGYHDPDYIYGHSEKSAALALCAATLKARALARKP